MLTNRLRMFQNRVQSRIFGVERQEVTGGYRKLQNKELHNLYSLPDITGVIKSRRIRMVGNVTCVGNKRNAFTIFFKKNLN
jgi:hypothetical protein